MWRRVVGSGPASVRDMELLCGKESQLQWYTQRGWPVIESEAIGCHISVMTNAT